MLRNGFRLLDPAEVDGAARAVLDGARAQFGFVPNLLRIMAASLTALKGYRTLSGLFHESGLTLAERLVVELTASVENGCGYCSAAHSMQAARAGLSAADIAAIRQGGLPGDPRLGALVTMVRALIIRRGAVAEDDVGAFLAAGFTRAQLLDVVTGIAAKTISNYTNNLAGAPLDPALREAGHSDNA